MFNGTFNTALNHRLNIRSFSGGKIYYDAYLDLLINSLVGNLFQLLLKTDYSSAKNTSAL